MDCSFQRKEFPFTQEEIRDIWKYAKDNHIDQLDKTPEQVFKAVADDLGLTEEWVAQAFTKPKAMRSITDEMYRKQYERRKAISSAKDYVADLNSPPALKALRKLYELPRSLLTLGHFTVFPETHAGDLKYHPTEWKNYVKTVVDTWKSVSPAYSQRLMNEMTAHPDYNSWLRAGLDIGLESRGRGILIGKTGPSARGWDALKPLRQRLAETRWNALDAADRTPENRKAIAGEINHITGTLSPGDPNFGKLGNFMFAPSLTMSKWLRATVTPAQTVNTFYRMYTGQGAAVSAAERAMAYHKLRAASSYLATRYLGLLAVNQAVLSAMGSKQQINITDPNKSDWLRPKGFGHVLNPRGAGEVFQLMGHVIASGYASKKELRGRTPTDNMRDAFSRYAQYKINPSVQLPIELATGHDSFGRPYPWSSDAGTPSKPRYTPFEFVSSLGPIPLQGGIREVYDDLRQGGVNALDATTIMKGLAAATIETLGGSVYPESKPKSRSRQPFQ